MFFYKIIVFFYSVFFVLLAKKNSKNNEAKAGGRMRRRHQTSEEVLYSCLIRCKSSIQAGMSKAITASLTRDSRLAHRRTPFGKVGEVPSLPTGPGMEVHVGGTSASRQSSRVNSSLPQNGPVCSRHWSAFAEGKVELLASHRTSRRYPRRP